VSNRTSAAGLSRVPEQTCVPLSVQEARSANRAELGFLLRAARPWASWRWSTLWRSLGLHPPARTVPRWRDARKDLDQRHHGTAQSLSAADVRVCSQSGNCLCNRLHSGIRIDGPVIQDARTCRRLNAGEASRSELLPCASLPGCRRRVARVADRKERGCRMGEDPCQRHARLSVVARP